MPRWIAIVGGVVALAGCRVLGPRSDGRGWRWTERRADYIRRSQVWRGRDLESWVGHMRTLDLGAGPAPSFPPESLVRCDYVEPPRDTLNGATPKFLCRHDAGGRAETLKVKWGRENAEVYAEVAGTRLFWALGFGADAVYPVRVECAGCSEDPWRDPAPRPGHVPPVFSPALVERLFAGETIEERPHEGWTWAELAAIDPSAGGAPQVHTDALRLLAAFVQHRDSKADNQRLVCLPDGIGGGESEPRSCTRPFMLIDDFGSAFGGPSVLATHKMTLAAWAESPVWKDPRACVANLTSERDATDGLDLPRIGEAGRRFLATLLDALDEAQVTALFTVARVEARGGVAPWVAAFERRRAEIAHPIPSDPAFRCPAQ